MSRPPEESRETASETPHQSAPSQQQTGQQPEQDITLEQLDAHITDAEQLHQDLSARLDSIPRD